MAYSFSQLQTYMQCPLKYRYRYIDKITTEEYAESADVVVGQIVHSCLEKLYKDINTMKTPSKQELLEYYKKLWEDKEKEIKEQGGNIKDIIDNDEYTISDYKARGEKYLTNYYDKHSPFKDIKVIDAEFNFAFEICENIKFQGRIDRLDKINDTFIINDYKTNKRLPIEDKENYIEQLTLYGIGIRQKYGKYFNVLKARLYFLHFDIEDEREITQKKCNEVLDKYTTIIKEIESKKATYELGNKSIFEAKESSLCKFCDYQSICPLFTYINTDDEVISELSPKTIKNLVDKFVEVKNKISELSKQEESLKNIFLQYIQKKDPKGEVTKYLLQGTIEDIKISVEPKYNVLDKEKFITKIKELGLFEKYADISWRKVNELFKKSGKIDSKEFENIVSKDISYKINKVKKKNSQDQDIET